eukprot:gene47734-58482_t
MSGEEASSGAEAPITLKVRDQAGEEMVFRVKKNTPMKKIFEAYAQRLGLNVSALKFAVDGEAVKDDHTPKMLELSDDDQIDVFIRQTGGSGAGEDVKPDGEAAITIHVKQANGESVAFKVKRSTKMQKICEAFANKMGIAVNMIRFLYDGTRLNMDDTPKFLEMEDGDQIDASIEQQGGRGR